MATSGVYSVLDNKNLIGLFDQMYEGAFNKGFSQKIGMAMPSDRETENYGWLGAAPSLDELKAESITEEGLNKFTFNLTNKEYAKAIPFKDKDLRRDKLGMIKARLGDFTMKAAEHWDSLIASLITNGATSGNNSYDGTTFFSATHNESGTNQKNALTSSEVSNLDVATATAPTADEMAAIIPKVVGKFFELTDDKGDPINGAAKSFTILCGTAAIWGPTLHALRAQYLTSGASNPTISVEADGYSFSVILTPRLSALTTKFYVFRDDSPVKPFILQEEVPLEPMVTDRSSDEFIKKRRFLLSIYTSRAAGYARWQSAMQCTLS